MKIYISIPISGHDLRTQAGKAMELAEKIRALGHEAVNPFGTPLAPQDWNDKEKYAYYMGEDLKSLLGCDAILMADPKWTKSKGCRLEFEAARIYGLQDYAKVEDIPQSGKGGEMDTENLVTYEQATRLKELGFNWKCNHYYNSGKDLCENLDYSAGDTAKDEDDSSYGYFNTHRILGIVCSAPTLAQAAKWLREAEGIYIEVRVRDLSKFEVAGKVIGISPTIEYLFDLWDYENPYPTYESALSAGIDAALERI